MHSVLVLLRTEDAVACVAEAGNNVTVLIEMIVKSCNVDIHIGMIFLHTLDTFGSADDAHELDVLYAIILQELDSCRSRAAGSEHWVNDDNVSLLDVGRHLEVVLNRLKSLRIAEQANVTDLDVGHHADHTVDHAEACAQDGNDRELLTGDALYGRLGNGSFNLYILEGKVSRCFIAHEHRYLGNEFSELLDGSSLVSEYRQLVQDEGVVKYAYLAHYNSPLFSPLPKGAYLYTPVTFRLPGFYTLFIHALLTLALGLAQAQIHRQKIVGRAGRFVLCRHADAPGALIYEI